MSYETTITSKGTITIASPIRKALGLKPGQKVRLSIDKNNKVIIDPGLTIEEFEALRDRIVKKIPPHLKGLTVRELKDKVAEAWVAHERNKS
jgi:AbrB family looped-hinge helix DNA binding protein